MICANCGQIEWRGTYHGSKTGIMADQCIRNAPAITYWKPATLQPPTEPTPIWEPFNESGTMCPPDPELVGSSTGRASSYRATGEL